MIVVVANDLSVRLEGPTDFKRFHIECHAPRGDIGALGKALAGRAALDGAEHAWLNEAAIVELSGLGQDAGFRAGFDKMLAFAESKGWVRGQPRQIRAHIVWQS